MAEVDLSCSEWRFWILPKPPKTKLVWARRDFGEYGDVLSFTGDGVEAAQSMLIEMQPMDHPAVPTHTGTDGVCAAGAA